jgi:hypothetical protein
LELKCERSDVTAKQLNSEYLMRMAAAGDSSDDSDGDENSEAEGWGEEGGEDDGAIYLKKGNDNTGHSLPYYMACMKMVMNASPEVVRQQQEIANGELYENSVS